MSSSVPPRLSPPRKPDQPERDSRQLPLGDTNPPPLAAEPANPVPYYLEPFVDAQVAAAHLSVTPRQLIGDARSGDLPGHPLPGRQRSRWRFKLSELDAAVMKQVHSPRRRGSRVR